VVLRTRLASTRGADVTIEHAQDMSALLRAVLRARAEVHGARGAKSAAGMGSGVTEQRALLRALETYAAALLLRGSPVPYRLHNELAMYRALFDIRRP
jgi:hypothetical protein